MISVFCFFKHEKQLAFLDRVVKFNAYLLNLAVKRGHNRVFHFHGFKVCYLFTLYEQYHRP